METRLRDVRDATMRPNSGAVMAGLVPPTVLILIAAAACLVPGARAAATDPADALRCE
jgi:hypothetical protein